MTQKTQLQAAGDGTAVPAGYVGQLVSSNLSGIALSVSTSAWNYSDCTGLSMTLDSGVWLLSFSAKLRSTAISGTGVGLSFAFRSGTNSTIYFVRQYADGVVLNQDYNVSATIPIVLSTTNVVKVSLAHDLGSAGSTTTTVVTSTGYNSAYFNAVRLA